MICIKKFLYSVAFVFLFSVFTVFGISPNTNATSISSTIDISSISSQYTSLSSLGLDTSVLDSSKNWYYTLSFVYNSTGSFNIPYLSCGSSFPDSNYLCRGIFTEYSLSSYSNVSSSNPMYYRKGSTFTYSIFDFTNSLNNDVPYIIHYYYLYFPTNISSNYSFLSLSIRDDFGSSPSGSLSITQNGTYDVTNYSEAVVNVPSEVLPGDYHDDLVSINNSIIICAGVALVIYFFYAIYRMMFKGVKS